MNGLTVQFLTIKGATSGGDRENVLPPPTRATVIFLQLANKIPDEFRLRRFLFLELSNHRLELSVLELQRVKLNPLTGGFDLRPAIWGHRGDLTGAACVNLLTDFGAR
jgi:hypothetical protein